MVQTRGFEYAEINLDSIVQFYADNVMAQRWKDAVHEVGFTYFVDVTNRRVIYRSVKPEDTDDGK